MKDNTIEDLLNLVQSDEIPTDIDSSETEPKLLFTNGNGAANFIIESSDDEEWQLIDLE